MWRTEYRWAGGAKQQWKGFGWRHNDAIGCEAVAKKKQTCWWKVPCVECSDTPKGDKALYVSTLDQRFTVGRQYREPWLVTVFKSFFSAMCKETSLAAIFKIWYIFLTNCERNTEQSCMYTVKIMYVHGLKLVRTGLGWRMATEKDFLAERVILG